MMAVGLGGITRHGCVALAEGSRIAGVCEQERVTRVRNAGFNASGLPDESLDLLLERVGRTRKDVGQYVLAEEATSSKSDSPFERVEHHLAHACAAYLTSPFSTAVILVCDDELPKVSLWEGRGPTVSRMDLQWTGPGFADAHLRCARAFGFRTPAGSQRFEALARLCRDGHGDRVTKLFELDGPTALTVDSQHFEALEDLIDGDAGISSRAALAAAVEARLGAVFIELLAMVRRLTTCDQVCLAGSFFYHSSINTLAKQSGLFKEVFIPIDPGNGGLAVGAVLHACGGEPRPVSPFMGPSYSAYETKETLDNCKLQYSWESEDTAIEIAVNALRKGQLVGWFDDAMEWGPRALGARCILANPFDRFVLENLNRFLKRREPWRGYAVSALPEAVPEYFEGPDAAPFMECNYRPRDPSRFSYALPSPTAAIRLQTVHSDTPPLFRRLLRAFATSSGLPFLINTSFNGFNEPLVCTPRDAVRVFYGSGLDLLVIGQFVLRK